MVPRAHFGSIPIGRVEISIDEPQFRWMREHGTLHIPDARAQNDFPMVGSVSGWRTFLAAPLRQQGELHWITGRTSHRGAPLHPGADQASRNLRRSGGDRDRERAVVPRSSKNHWSSKRQRVKSWASSPVHPRIFSQCSMRWRRVPRDYATQPMRDRLRV